MSILTPYQHDAEGNTAAFIADFTSDLRPGSAPVRPGPPRLRPTSAYVGRGEARSSSSTAG